MIRFLLYTIAALFLFRIFFRITRALSRTDTDSRSGPGDRDASHGDARAGRDRSRVKAATERERSSAIEVPFTEIPPEEPARRQ